VPTRAEWLTRPHPLCESHARRTTTLVSAASSIRCPGVARVKARAERRPTSLLRLSHKRTTISRCFEYAAAARDAIARPSLCALGQRCLPADQHAAGGPRTAPIDCEACFLACCRTIEFNPVRARMVRHPRAWRWSSYRAHPHGVTESAAERPRAVRPAGQDAGRPTAGRSGALPRRARREFRRWLAPRPWRLGTRRHEVQAADRQGSRSPRRPLPKGRPRKAKSKRQ
jgi:hypothetical protein